MPTRYALTNIPYTLADIRLGSLIPSVKRPDQDTFASSLPLKEGVDYKWRNENNPEFSLQEEGTESIRASLTKFLSLWATKTNSRDTLLTANEGRIYNLVEPKGLFDTLVGTDDCKKWLIKAHDEGETVHFIVGYRTYFETKEKNEIIKESDRGVVLQVPVAEATGSPTALSAGALDSGLEADASRHTHEQNSSSFQGERIFAICLRRVRFNWFKSKDSPPARLNNDNAWIVMSLRGADGPDAIEVDLEEPDWEGSEVLASLTTDPASDDFVIVALE